MLQYFSAEHEYLRACKTAISLKILDSDIRETNFHPSLVKLFKYGNTGS